jgi:hypothetical protein
MGFAGVETVGTGYDPGYSDAQIDQYQRFIVGATTVDTLDPLLHPGHERTSLWTDGALVGLPGQSGTSAESRPDPRVDSHYLQARGHAYFRGFREMVGSLSQADPNRALQISYVPVDAFMNLPGLPRNIRDLYASTVVGVARIPYEQTADLPDWPPDQLVQLGRERFETVPLRAGTTWEVNVVFALHTAGGLAIGRTGLVHDGPDVPAALRAQVLAERHQGPAVQALAPEVVARHLYHAAV